MSCLDEESKPIKKLRDLTRNILYRILDGKFTNSKLGAVVLLELEEDVTCLPNLFVTEAYSPFIHYFKSQNYSMVFRGVEDFNKSQLRKQDLRHLSNKFSKFQKQRYFYRWKESDHFLVKEKINF